MERSKKPEFISIYEAPRPDQLPAGLDPSAVEERAKAKLVNKATKLVDQHPEDAIRVLRGWLNDNR